MNRWKYTSPLLLENESTITCERNVRIYDGDQKTNFEGGELIITTHRILWGRPGDIAKGQTCLGLNLNLVACVEEQSSSFSFSRSRKVILHLYEAPNDNLPGPQQTSIYNYTKLSFRDGYNSDVVGILVDCVRKSQAQLQMSTSTSKPSSSNQQQQQPQRALRFGIVGIERNLEEKQKATDESISIAFQDLNKLMAKAKEMVILSRTISTKIREKQGDISEDETIRFKSYLLRLGIDDPVTRDDYKSNNEYYRKLSEQICEILFNHIEEVGGMVILADVFCRVNRARGLDLLSPEDILIACRLMTKFDLPLKLHQFNSGVIVLQLSDLDSETIAQSTADLVEKDGSLTYEELTKTLGIPTTLAKERLLTAEKYGKICRDDSIEGLRFYPNLFLTQDV